MRIIKLMSSLIIATVFYFAVVVHFGGYMSAPDKQLIQATAVFNSLLFFS